MHKLFIIGHPGLYGGAGSELHHQIKAWSTMKELELHCIPTMHHVELEPLYPWMKSIGVIYHVARDYSSIKSEDGVINFCSDTFLKDLSLIHEKTKRIMWANCMTFLFPLEKEQSIKGFISHYLYQRKEVKNDHDYKFDILGRTSGQSMVFSPYFDSDSCEFSINDDPETHIGRISRQDIDKYSKDTMHIYEYIVSPKYKRAHFMGFNHKVTEKIGSLPSWVTTYTDQNTLSVKDFYKKIDFIVQSTDTTENLPRIGFEAMFSGKPLVVDNRGGWKNMIEHGVSGFLCNHARDFIYYGSRLAYDLDLRLEIAYNALEKAESMSSLDQSVESWRKVFESAYN